MAHSTALDSFGPSLAMTPVQVEESVCIAGLINPCNANPCASCCREPVGYLWGVLRCWRKEQSYKELWSPPEEGALCQALLEFGEKKLRLPRTHLPFICNTGRAAPK